MGIKILQTDIKRKDRCLYYCKGDPIAVYEAEMNRVGGKARKSFKKKNQ